MDNHKEYLNLNNKLDNLSIENSDLQSLIKKFETDIELMKENYNKKLFLFNSTIIDKDIKIKTLEDKISTLQHEIES